MPTFVPPNVKFEVDDVESEWIHPQKFSWIFCRYMAASIHDWPKLVNNIYESAPLPISLLSPARGILSSSILALCRKANWLRPYLVT